jgi:phospholipase C
MRRRGIVAASLLVAITVLGLSVVTARAEGNVHKVNHVIIIMQENHSFDNYFGALPYAPGSPYHQCRNQHREGHSARTSDMGGSGGDEGGGGDQGNDHQCVDGLTCSFDTLGNLNCTNSNLDDDGSTVTSFHDANYCPAPDLQHSWQGSHAEANFSDPANALLSSINDGFVLVNDATEQHDSGESATDDDTMGYYTQDDLPFYYQLAQTFAIDDRYFCSVVGPTFPNRSYEMAATAFGHVTTNEIFPPGVNPANPFLINNSDGYKPVTGSIFDLLDAAGVTWLNYAEDLPTSPIFRGNRLAFLTAHIRQLFNNVLIKAYNPTANNFFQDAAGGTLPQVSFIDPSFIQSQLLTPAGPVFVGPGHGFETDEHPPWDIRAGEYVTSQIINAVRNGPNWKDSVIFLTYDEHGGSYDHVAPPAASQGGALNPDGIDPGLCEDLSNPPTSLMPGGGAECEFSEGDVAAICSTFTAETAPYPAMCANFNQLGFRVPFIVISPFAKPHYVSHTVGDHTSMLAFIEQRFLPDGSSLTLRDQNASRLQDMFDFNHSPSLNAVIGTAPVPVPGEHNCP